MNLDELFSPEYGFRHRALLSRSIHPWSPVENLASYIKEWFADFSIEEDFQTTVAFVTPHTIRRNESLEKMVYIEKPVLTEKPLYIKELRIYIGKGTILEPTAIIKGPAIIGSNCEIRQGAYLRGNVLTGDHSVLGHTTEVKNSIVMNHSEAGHFSYIGDAVIGSYVNLGAGTKIANLEFRTVEEKMTGQIRSIQIHDSGKRVNTGMPKLGALIGDGCELGCNSVTSPGTILGQNTRVFPLTTVKKGFYPRGSTIS